MKQKQLTSAIKKTLKAEVLLSAALMTTAYAQAAPAQGAAAPITASGAVGQPVTTLEKVEITGSLLKSADKVGFNQVQVVTAKDIQDSGATTVANFLRSMAANSASSWAENNTNSFSPGGAGMALRGLSEKYTLVLVDGHRVAPYAFAVNATDSFFDLNTIPLNMVERIEIVKTGAVSQYGSDAIAGVVNIITKKNFQGVQLDGGYGGATSGGNGTANFGITAGFGDLNADRFNVTAGMSVYHSAGITAADRDFEKNEDYRGLPGGSLEHSTAYWYLPNGAGYAPLSPCPYGGSAVSTEAVGSAQPGGVCAANNASAYTIAPDADRINAKIHATFKIDDSTEAYADLWESYNTTQTKEGYRSIGSTSHGYNPATGGVLPISNVVPASNPYNPYGIAMPIKYTFLSNPATVKANANFFSASTGIKGTLNTGLGAWDWNAAIGHSQSIVSVTDGALLNIPALNNIINNGGFDFANPGATPHGLDGLFQSDSKQAVSKLDVVDLTTTNSSLFSLPAGDVGLGLGVQFQHQSEVITPMSGVLNGTEAPPSLQMVEGQRNVAAAYYQIDIPIVKGLTFSQSSRFDHYSDFGSAFSPRFALRFQPIPMLTTYASYNRGFRAPTMIENSRSESFFAQNALDPFNVMSSKPGLVQGVNIGNPQLQPERTKNYNIGFQLSPNSTTDFGFDWYKIDISNVIGAPALQDLVDANDPGTVHRNPDTTISYVDAPMQNLGDMTTSGLEATFRKSLPTGFGTFTLSGDWAYILHFKANGIDYAGSDLAFNLPFGASIPRWKGETNLAWNYRKFTTTLTWQYTGPISEVNNGDAQPKGIASYSQFNLFATYNGIKHWTLYGGINNIMDKTPPYNSYSLGYGSGYAYDPSLYSDTGRFIQVGATYRF
jgi:iron complex outermembrane receptor protein